MSKLWKGIVAATVLAASGLAATAPAEARYHRGNGDAALVAGIVGLGVGAAIASDRGYGGGNYYAYDSGPAYYQPAYYGGYDYGYSQPLYYANYGYDRRYYGRHRGWDRRGYGYHRGYRDYGRGYRDHGRGYRDNGRGYRDRDRGYRGDRGYRR